jgi:cell division protein FtsL
MTDVRAVAEGIARPSADVAVRGVAGGGRPGRRRAPAGPLAVVARTCLLVGAVAAVGVVHVWSHTRVTAAGYRLGELQRAQEALRAQRDRLEVEVATLRAPGRLEEFARTRLKMAPPAPGAVVAGGKGVAAAGRVGEVGGREIRRPPPAEPVAALAVHER